MLWRYNKLFFGTQTHLFRKLKYCLERNYSRLRLDHFWNIVTHDQKDFTKKCELNDHTIRLIR